jgi:DNA-binding NarL/FixJ family response regulator
MKLSRLMLADDHQLLLEAFRKFLEPHFDVVGTATDGVALLEGAQTLRPDVVVTDLAMPVLNGLGCRAEAEANVAGSQIDFPNHERRSRFCDSSYA